jgi:hypothetical protein
VERTSTQSFSYPHARGVGAAGEGVAGLVRRLTRAHVLNCVPIAAGHVSTSGNQNATTTHEQKRRERKRERERDGRERHAQSKRDKERQREESVVPGSKTDACIGYVAG